MKNIKQIRENYNAVTKAKELQANKLNTLVRAGLFESNKLPIVKRMLEKDPSKMTIAERKVAMSLLESLMSEFIAQNYEQLDEAASHLTKLDTRVKQGYPTDKEMPFIIILKRKAIRVYPDNQKVGLYYSQALDKYVSIPFGPNMGSISEALNPNYRYQGTLSDKESDPRYVTHTYTSGGKTKIRRADLYAQRVADLDPKDYKQLQKAYGSDPSLRWYEALGAKAGAAYARWKDKPSSSAQPSSSRVPNTQTKAPLTSPWGSATTKTSKPTVVSTSTPTAPATPKATTPKATKAAATPKIPVKKGRITKQKQEKLGLGDQPDFAFPDVEKKTKTFTYRSTEAPARELTPLEKSSGTERPQAQLPRKRLGFDPKPAGTGPQPEVKTKAPGKRFMQKLQEKRELYEQAARNLVTPGEGLARGLTPSEKNQPSFEKRFIGQQPSTTPKPPNTNSKIGRFISRGILGAAKGARGGPAAAIAGAAIETMPLWAPEAKPGDAEDVAKAREAVGRKFRRDATRQRAATEPSKAPDQPEVKAPEVSAPEVKAPEARVPEAPKTPVEIETPTAPEVAKPSDTTVTPQQSISAAPAPVVAPIVTPSASPGASLRTRRDQARKNKEDKQRRQLEPLPLPDLGGSEKDIKRPPKFGLDIGLNRPQMFDPYVTLDRRTQTAYYKTLTKEETEDEREILRRLKRERAKTYSYSFSGKANTSAPQPSSSSTPLTYQRRIQQRELQYYTQPQTVSESIGYMLDNNIKEMNINIKGTDVKINTTIANKINNLYESLNDENKTKMISMLDESVDSFKQILDFAVRQ